METLVNGCLTVLMSLVLVPLGLIWSLNTLFVSGAIRDDWKSLLAMLVLLAVLQTRPEPGAK